MVTQEVNVINRLGLHARAAAKFVTLASSFESDIRVARSGRTVNGKSIMGVMMLAAAKGTVIEISADGWDEQQAIAALKDLVANRFGEDD
ncbi:MAG: phosphocarrier protein HPr [Thiotrichales bacterium SG8_50]|nr:MAG: phosphocarrier protein HPr [Thiotrichales bacterium SG8_50]